MAVESEPAVENFSSSDFLAPLLEITGGAIKKRSNYNYWLQSIFAPNVELPCALIWDGCGAHWSEDVVAAAAELQIELIRMPPGYTNERQPLEGQQRCR